MNVIMGIALKKLTEPQRADIAQTLFQVDLKLTSKNELRGLCPIHDEKNASFSYNVAKDVYNCLSCQATGDLVTLYCKCRGLNNKTGFKAFLQEYGIETNDHVPAAAPRQPKPKPEAGLDYTLMREAWAKFPPLPDSWVNRMVETRHWTREAIELLDLRMQTHRRDSKSGNLVCIKNPEWRKIAFPIFEDGELVNIILYKPGADEFKMVSWARGFGSTRLFPPAPLYDGLVLYVEGITDVVCALSQGFNPISNTTKPKHWKREHLNRLMDREIVIARDCDQAGMKYGDVAARNLYRVCRSLKLINWPAFMGRRDDGQWPEKHGDDLTDFFARHGRSPEDLQDLMDHAEPYVMKDPGEISCAREFFAYGMSDRLSFKPRLLAERILQEISLLNDPETGLLYKWNKKHWEIFKDDHVKRLCMQLLGEESKANRVNDAAFQAKVLSTIPHGRAVNDRDSWVCVENGMLNLDTLEERPHDKNFYSTYTLPVHVNLMPEKSCTRWLQFLDETIRTPAVIAQLQEYFGYCLTRDTRYGKALFLFGPGSDGKSTVIKILRRMVGLHRLREQDGFTRCDETDDLLMEYKFTNNPVLSFVADRCNLGEGMSVPKEDLFGTYDNWARGKNFTPMNYDNFFRELYAAVDNLSQYRARNGARRVQCVKNIQLKILM